MSDEDRYEGWMNWVASNDESEEIIDWIEFESTNKPIITATCSERKHRSCWICKWFL